LGGLYVDTSALGRVLLDEPDAGAILRELDRFDTQVSSRLVRVELRRLGLRKRVLDTADQLLGGVALVPVDEAVLAAAETVPPAGVATLDAVHLVTAVRLAGDDLIEAVMTYDARLADGVRHHGLAIVAPGA
jgi:predicted nucleic acid-binding protein